MTSPREPGIELGPGLRVREQPRESGDGAAHRRVRVRVRARFGAGAHARRRELRVRESPEEQREVDTVALQHPQAVLAQRPDCGAPRRRSGRCVIGVRASVHALPGRAVHVRPVASPQGVRVLAQRDPQLAGHAVGPCPQVRALEILEDGGRRGHGGIGIGVDHGEQRLGQARQVPQRDARLVAVGVAALDVDRAEARIGREAVHEGARPVVDRLPGDRHVVRVHDPVDETRQHPLRDQVRLRPHHAAQQAQRRDGLLTGLGPVAVDRVLDQVSHGIGAQMPRGVLERADPQMARGRAREDRAALGHGAAAQHGPPRLDHGQAARGRDAQGVHRLADQQLTQHRAQRCPAVAAACQGRGADALEMQITEIPVRIDEVPEQEGAAIAQLRIGLAELMARIHLGHRERLARKARGAGRGPRGVLDGGRGGGDGR